MRNLAIGAVLTVALVTPVRPTEAQSYTLLHSFASLEQWPRRLVQTADGSFLGVTAKGGANGRGSVFRVSSAGAISTLHSFSGPDGAEPYGPLAPASDGNYYGTTALGGAAGKGTVFRINPAGLLATLHSFSGADGAEPRGGVIQGADGNLYGTTFVGGASSYGTVYRITLTAAFATLHSFNGADGWSPLAGLVQGSDGDLYGTTCLGGTGNSAAGTVFKITPSGALTSLRSFSMDSDGTNPSAGLVQGTDGNFYGTTTLNGAGGYGDAFRITPGGALTVLHHFVAATQSCLSDLVQGADGNFYGTTSREEGSTSSVIGTVFRITPAAAFTVLNTFTGDTGALPETGVIQGADGGLYGSTRGSGAHWAGSVFRVTTGGTSSTFASFSGSDAGGPAAGLVQSADGDFYGTTAGGGTSGSGTVFKITPAGMTSTLHSFEGTDGSSPGGVFAAGADGALYGTTTWGGPGGFGTVFRITPSGIHTVLCSFSGSNGALPYAGVTLGPDGNFYGTTFWGGFKNDGTVFRVTPGGTLTPLHGFDGTDGATPYGALAVGPDGDLYGTTSQGGAHGYGTVFKITQAGTLTTLHSFDYAEGTTPRASLVLGADGDLYGTTNRGAAGNGSVFRMTLAGALTNIHSFAVTDGQYPYAPLVKGSDGNLYGTTLQGGAGNSGTLFRITPSGVLTTQHSFEGSDGATPYAGVLQGTDGHLYGTTYEGGPSGGGVVFRLTLGPGPAPTVTGVSPSSGAVAGGTIVTVSGTDFQPGAAVTFGGTPAAGVTYVSATTLYVLSPMHAAGVVSVTVANPDLQAATLASAFTYRPGPAPAIFAISPSNGPTLGGTFVTITGSNFVNGASIAIGGVPASGVTFVDPATLTATTGAHVTGTADVVVTNPDPQAATLVAGYFFAPPPSPTTFSPLTPCRIVDTRSLSTGGPALVPSSTRTFTLAGSCGVPANAVAVAANLTVVSRGPGYLAAFPGNAVYPGTSNLSFGAGQTRAANAILYLATDGTGAVKVLNGSGGTNDFIVDVSGFFQ